MDFKIKIKGKEYHIELKEEKGLVKIKIKGKEFVFGSNRKEALLNAQTSKGSSRKEIASSLSGTVIAVFVKEGENIEAGKKLLILSAMKMENEIVSESAGKIKKIMVKENQQVKEGDVLIILE
jgi:biotin carboxyl carrier protein